MTVTNTTRQDLVKGTWALSYRWTTRGGRDVTTAATRRSTPLPTDLAPGEKTTVTAAVRAPASLFGDSREDVTLTWDLLNTATGQWLSKTAGVVPLALGLILDGSTSDQLGLEQFYQYSGLSTGSGSSLMVNQFAGNAVFGYNAFSHPSRGPATFLRTTYNSQELTGPRRGVLRH